MNGLLQLTSFLEGARDHNLTLLDWVVKLVQAEKEKLQEEHTHAMARLDIKIESLRNQFMEQDEEFATILGVAPNQLELSAKSEVVAFKRVKKHKEAEYLTDDSVSDAAPFVKES
jgi:hypothetical protein